MIRYIKEQLRLIDAEASLRGGVPSISFAWAGKICRVTKVLYWPKKYQFKNFKVELDVYSPQKFTYHESITEVINALKEACNG